jgi:hypothetical protein
MQNVAPNAGRDGRIPPTNARLTSRRRKRGLSDSEPLRKPNIPNRGGTFYGGQVHRKRKENHAMLTFVWNSSVRIHAVLQRYAPTNIILGALRQRRYLK